MPIYGSQMPVGMFPMIEDERRRAALAAPPQLPAPPQAQAAAQPQADPDYWKANLAMGLAGRVADLLGSGNAGPQPISIPTGAMLGMDGLRTLYGIQKGNQDAQTAWQMYQQQREDAARREAGANARTDREFGARQQARGDELAWRGYEAQNQNAWNTAQWNRGGLYHEDQMGLARDELEANKDYRKETLMQGWEGLKIEKDKLAKYLAAGGGGGGGGSGGALSGAKLDAIAGYMQSQGYSDEQINSVIAPMIEQYIGVPLPEKPATPPEDIGDRATAAVANTDWTDMLGIAHDLPFTTVGGKQAVDRSKLVAGRKYKTQAGIAYFDGKDLWVDGMK